jgi:hypothetical protein
LILAGSWLISAAARPPTLKMLKADSSEAEDDRESTIESSYFRSDSQLAGTLPAGPGTGWLLGCECGGSNSTPLTIPCFS